jgi:CheY-like chemotaxis protein
MTDKPSRSWAKRIVSSGAEATARLATVRRVVSVPAAARSSEPVPSFQRRIDREPGLIGAPERLDSDELPAEVLALPPLSAQAVARIAAPAHRPRAIVVDDDPEIRRALARLLRPELDVWLAGSVAQAEAVLADLDRVDVAFVDWELPDGTGEQILERLAHWPDAIRVLISARVVSSENPLKNRALANLVLGKPVARGVVEALKRATLVLPPA